MELSKFIDLFLPDGDAHVVYWDKDSEEIDEAPLWEGNITDTPYWLAATYNIGRYDKEWGSAIDLRHSLDEDHKDMPGLVITLIEKE